MTHRPEPVSPPPSPTLAPHLVVADAPGAIAFYKRAFGATEKMRLADPKLGGNIVHAELVIGDARFTLAEEAPEWNTRGPRALGGTPVVLTLHVEDADAVAARALEAGARIIYPIADQFYGQRAGRIEDPFGHQWILSTFIEDVPMDEMQTRLARWWEEQGKGGA
ncbi:glyoxalase [Sorangium cellulosum]|jgi:PhnB protein|uniref:Glyoxalase n=1 Tax=Sorangium cellulosum TaxID=56 RepID=A0A4V0NE49_SORCE|nr:VOC family protein [Sorangium cellulosum]AUX24932.1 glyoxalase [Sorangium cellulosum]